MKKKRLNNGAYRAFVYNQIGVKIIDEYVKVQADIKDMANKVSNEPLAGFAPFKITEEIAERMLDEIF